MATTVVGNAIIMPVDGDTTDDVLGSGSTVGVTVDAMNVTVFLAAGGPVVVDDALGNVLFTIDVPTDETVSLGPGKYTNGVGHGNSASSTITVMLR